MWDQQFTEVGARELAPSTFTAPLRTQVTRVNYRTQSTDEFLPRELTTAAARAHRLWRVGGGEYAHFERALFSTFALPTNTQNDLQNDYVSESRIRALLIVLRTVPPSFLPDHLWELLLQYTLGELCGHYDHLRVCHRLAKWEACLQALGLDVQQTTQLLADHRAEIDASLKPEDTSMNALSIQTVSPEEEGAAQPIGPPFSTAVRAHQSWRVGRGEYEPFDKSQYCTVAFSGDDDEMLEQEYERESTINAMLLTLRYARVDVLPNHLWDLLLEMMMAQLSVYWEDLQDEGRGHKWAPFLGSIGIPADLGDELVGEFLARPVINLID